VEHSRPAIRFELTAKTIFALLGVVAASWLLWKLWFVLVMVIIALILAAALRPLCVWLEERKVPRSVALALVFFGLLAVLAFLCLVTIPPLVTQLVDIMERAPAMQARVAAWMGRSELLDPLAASVRRARISELMALGGEWILAYGSRILVMLTEAVTVVFLAVYFLSGREREQAALFAVLPRRWHLRAARILLNLQTIVGGYVRGQIITSIAMALFTFALLTLVGVDNALAIAVFAGLTNVIPLVGAIIAGAPAVLAALPLGFGRALIVLVAMIVYQEVESRVLVPRVYGRVLRLSPVAVVVALLIGAVLMGIIGALLALPAAAAIRMVIKELRVGMPGEDIDDTELRARDERAEREFAARAAGAPATVAAAIANEMAEQIRETDAPGDPEAAAEVPVTGGEAPSRPPV
jgi:predicted PurR-regulated permease PerM